jgi:hypothetical protein
LTFTNETFALPNEILDRQFFERFDRRCDEIKRASPAARANGPERPWLILNVRAKT